MEVELDSRELGDSRLDRDPPYTGKSGVGGVGRLGLVDEREMGGVQFRDQLRLYLLDQGVDHQATDRSQPWRAGYSYGLSYVRLLVMAYPSAFQRRSTL